MNDNETKKDQLSYGEAKPLRILAEISERLAKQDGSLNQLRMARRMKAEAERVLARGPETGKGSPTT